MEFLSSGSYKQSALAPNTLKYANLNYPHLHVYKVPTDMGSRQASNNSHDQPGYVTFNKQFLYADGCVTLYGFTPISTGQ